MLILTHNRNNLLCRDQACIIIAKLADLQIDPPLAKID